MREIQNPDRRGKGDSRGLQDDAIETQVIGEQRRAFALGKGAFRTKRTVAGNPFVEPALRASWLAGWRFAAQEAEQQRPLDTVRVKP